MPNFSFVPLEGTIQNIRPFGDECCSSLVTLQTSEGTVTVVVSSDTYVISEVRLRRGMTVAAFYDAQVPVPLIYPPQYRAVILGRKQPNETITVDYFDETLTNNDNTLKLNVSPATDIVGSNGQPFRWKERFKTFVLSAMNVAAPLSLCRHLKVLSQLSYQVIRMSSVKYAFAAA